MLPSFELPPAYQILAGRERDKGQTYPSFEVWFCGDGKTWSIVNPDDRMNESDATQVLGAMPKGLNSHIRYQGKVW